MTYQEALDFLYSQLPMFSRTGAPAYKPGLDTSLKLAELFDNPQNKFKSIHVGGTNGKGSVSHIIASVLQSQGYKVGLYTSPHLVDFRERMRINGKMITKEKVVEFVENWRMKSASQTFGDSRAPLVSAEQLKPSFFELTMIMAFDWFAQEKVDYAVIEVGMGGRLDSTNIITPILSVITNISHDHTQFLGNTLEKIAAEKAGIIKKNVSVLIGETQPETGQIFRKKAEQLDSRITFADQKCEMPRFEESEKGWKVVINDFEFSVPLGGEYQKKNINTAFEAFNILRQEGIEITQKSILKGFENVCSITGLMGRWMILGRYPLTIADTGHNIAGMSYNIAQLARIMERRPNSKLRIVIGFVADKDIDKIMALLPFDAVYYVTNAQIPRALPAHQLWIKFNEMGFNASEYCNVTETFKKAKEEATEEDIIFIGGSTFVVADFLEHYLNV